MVVAGGPTRGIRAAVMAAPKMMAPKISTDIIPIIISNCFFDGPHPTSLSSPWVRSGLDWNGVLVLERADGDWNGVLVLERTDGSFVCAGFSWTVWRDLRLVLRDLLVFPLAWTRFG